MLPFNSMVVAVEGVGGGGGADSAPDSIQGLSVFCVAAAVGVLVEAVVARAMMSLSIKNKKKKV